MFYVDCLFRCPRWCICGYSFVYCKYLIIFILYIVLAVGTWRAVPVNRDGYCVFACMAVILSQPKCRSACGSQAHEGICRMQMFWTR